MTTTITDTINQGLQEVLKGLQAGVGFAEREIPLLLQEKLAYDFYSSLFYLVSGIVLFILSIFWLRFCATKAEKDGEVAYLVGGIISSVVTVLISISMFFVNIPILIQIHFAPRLYLMEWLMEMVKAKT